MKKGVILLTAVFAMFLMISSSTAVPNINAGNNISRIKDKNPKSLGIIFDFLEMIRNFFKKIFKDRIFLNDFNWQEPIYTIRDLLFRILAPIPDGNN